MPDLIKYRQGDEALLQFIDLSTVDVRAIGRKNIASLLHAMLDYPNRTWVFGEFHFDDSKHIEGKPQVAQFCRVTSENAKAKKGLPCRRAGRHFEPQPWLKSRGMHTHIEATSYKSALVACDIITWLANNQSVYYSIRRVDVKQRDGTMKNIKVYKFEVCEC